MALTIRVAANDADLTAINTLFNKQVAGTSIRDELIADFGNVIPFTLAAWHPMLSDKNTRLVMGFNPAATLRGACYWTNEQGIWTVRLIGLDKSLTAQQRLDGFHDFVIELASRVPATTQCRGIVKSGGKLDTYMQSRLAVRIVQADGFIRYETTAAEMIAKL